MTDFANRLRTPTNVVIALVVVVLVVATTVILLGTATKQATAYFSNANSVYAKDRVRILGVDVGRIESVEPQPDGAKVTLEYDSKYVLPADVKAAVISPSLVSARYIELSPLRRGGAGPAFPDDGVIPRERTASPLEFDDLKTEIKRLATSLGPNALDKNGALSRFLDVSAANGRGGQGARFNETVRAASDAMQTLADGRQDLFGTISNLQVFVTGLTQVDDQVAEFNKRLASVSGTLDDNKDELTAALQSVDRAAGLVDKFIAENKDPLNETVDQLGGFTRVLAESRDDLATVLHVGPNTLMNVFNIYSPRSRALRGTLIVDNLNTPADSVCNAFANVLAKDPTAASRQCGTAFGPLLNVLRMQQPPIGVNPLAGPSYPSPDQGAGTQPFPDARAPGVQTPNDPPGLGGLRTPGGN